MAENLVELLVDRSVVMMVALKVGWTVETLVVL